jgi:uncharacterized protein
MRATGNRTEFSASDLVNFSECAHLTTLDLRALEEPLERADDEEETRLIQGKGQAHEQAYLAHLQATGAKVADMRVGPKGPDAAVARTLEAMRAGADVIYQGALRDGRLTGYTDFLRRVPHPSQLGDYSYEVVDTKLARTPKATAVLQLVYYSDLLAAAQGTAPLAAHLVLGTREERTFRVADYAHYYAALKARFLAHVDAPQRETYPHPCERCRICHWRDLCEAKRLEDDHLGQVADIRRTQIKRLTDAGISTLAALAQVPAGQGVKGIQAETLAKLRRQAALQLGKKQTGENEVEFLEPPAGAGRGFARLPPPSEGDIFFDMEGDPLEEGGLEYLFGVVFRENGQLEFRPFWAHSRAEERVAFEAFMDFVAARLARFPDLHIYHYASYEVTALRRLMSLHGTRESAVDDLLERHKFVDLYRVVRETIQVSEPGYSIKNLETFYRDGKREGEVTNAGASIVYYERWKALREDAILEEIRRYNEDDCRSTAELCEWLRGLAPSGGTAPASEPALAPVPPAKSAKAAAREAERVKAEERREACRQQLAAALPPDRELWTPDDEVRELTLQLLDFHRRQAKPAWWALFDRQEMTEEELVEDPQCIGGMTRVPEAKPIPEDRSLVYTYRFEPQDFKLKTGDECARTDTREGLGKVGIDEEARIARIKIGAKREPPPQRLSIGPGSPLRDAVLREAVRRFAESVIEGSKRYAALEAFLRKDPPRIDGRAAGAPVVADAGSLAQVTEAVAGLRESSLFIQGPPGAGKTYTGSHVIVALLARGKRVGVSSNSHKAINNLLAKVEEVAKAERVAFRGAKRANGNEDTRLDGTFIEDVDDNDDVADGNFQLIAGTAWLFADPQFDQTLDYLFVDEAGQVAVGNLVAMGTSAKNLVLLGDQMQLGQPVQGVHPGRSGDSSLEYLLDGIATIPADRGVFLEHTWRMHPDVCRFISEAVYDGRLQPEQGTANQKLVLGHGAHAELRPTGVRFVPAAHDGCRQRSAEEAELVAALYRSLLEQRYVDRDGVEHPMRPENILVVAPYNMQVNLLKQNLPGARVGTVDKFQGQEAEAVIVSMTTSSGDDLPRNMEFLFSKNRLNVAISRARCLALVVASPKLLDVRCTTPEQMALVNTLCWVKSVSEGSER